jgi:DNA polymerase delta subunit 1
MTITTTATSTGGYNTPKQQKLNPFSIAKDKIKLNFNLPPKRTKNAKPKTGSTETTSIGSSSNGTAAVPLSYDYNINNDFNFNFIDKNEKKVYKYDDDESYGQVLEMLQKHKTESRWRDIILKKTNKSEQELLDIQEKELRALSAECTIEESQQTEVDVSVLDRLFPNKLAKQLNPSKDDLYFQLKNVDFLNGKPIDSEIIPNPHKHITQDRTINRCFGRTAEGDSVTVHSHNLLQHFVALVPDDDVKQLNGYYVDTFKANLEKQLSYSKSVYSYRRKFVIDLLRSEQKKEQFQQAWNDHHDNEDDDQADSTNLDVMILDETRKQKNGIIDDNDDDDAVDDDPLKEKEEEGGGGGGADGEVDEYAEIMNEAYDPLLEEQQNLSMQDDSEEKAKEWEFSMDLINERIKETKWQPIISHIEIVEGRSFLNYSKSKKKFLKIYLTLPQFLRDASDILHTKGHEFYSFSQKKNVHRTYSIFDTKIAFDHRFRLDTNISGTSWIRIPAGCYTTRKPPPSPISIDPRYISQEPAKSRTDIEIDVSWEKIIALSHTDLQWTKIAPFRLLSYDIEVKGRKGFFPQSAIDGITQIGCQVYIEGVSTNVNPSVLSVIFTLNTCLQIEGAQVIVCKTERELLRKFSQFCIDIDFDGIFGYNNNNFDNVYVDDRCKLLKVPLWKKIGRIIDQDVYIKNTKFESKQAGRRSVSRMYISGRFVFDMLTVMLGHQKKFRSYTLNAISKEVLNDQKDDIHFSLISVYQDLTSWTRQRLCTYCLKDALLPVLLLLKLKLLIDLIEMSRETGVLLDTLLYNGKQIQVFSKITMKLKGTDFFVENYKAPEKEPGAKDEKYEGATVIEPIRGYYTVPIATLDFASLYPSIMIAHNLCYSTIIMNPTVQNLAQHGLTMEDVEINEVGGEKCAFVKATTCEGILPEVLRELLKAREVAKKMLKQSIKDKDDQMESILECRQKSIKVVANSVYGFTGAVCGIFPCLRISSSVTLFGRDAIQHTKDRIEAHFTIANGYRANARVLYGDTDSVMIDFGVETVEEAIRLAKEAEVLVSNDFPAPMKIVFEKVFLPFLLVQKKQYAGLLWETHHEPKEMCSKGIKHIRRDACIMACGIQGVLIDKLINIIFTTKEEFKETMIKRKQEAIDYTMYVIYKLENNLIPLSDLIISKALSKDPDDPTYNQSTAQVQISKRITQRDPSMAPKASHRVEWIQVQQPKNVKKYMSAETPEQVLEKNIPIDVDYYKYNQLLQPVSVVLTPLIGPENVKKIFEGGSKHNTVNKRQKGMKLLTFGNGQDISMFAKEEKYCKNPDCGFPLSMDEKSLNTQDIILCSQCLPNAEMLMRRFNAELLSASEEIEKQMGTCYTCKNGDLEKISLCNLLSCPTQTYRKRAVDDFVHCTNEIIDIEDLIQNKDKYIQKGMDMAKNKQNNTNITRQLLNISVEVKKPFKETTTTKKKNNTTKKKKRAFSDLLSSDDAAASQQNKKKKQRASKSVIEKKKKVNNTKKRKISQLLSSSSSSPDDNDEPTNNNNCKIAKISHENDDDGQSSFSNGLLLESASRVESFFSQLNDE